MNNFWFWAGAIAFVIPLWFFSIVGFAHTIGMLP